MTLVNPADSLERQNAKLLLIADALMRRVEDKSSDTGIAYAQFERAALLEVQVRQRTTDLERALDLLHESNARLGEANTRAERAHANLADAIETVSDGFALFDAEDCLVLSNSRFCQDFRDVAGQLRPGLTFPDYVSLISRSRFLHLPEGETPEIWAESRAQRHSQNHEVFNVRLLLDRWLQVSEYRTSSGGTVILQTDVTEIMREERNARHRLMDRQAQTVRATLEHLNQGVCIFDGDLRLAEWNRRAFDLLGVAGAERVQGLGFDRLLDLITKGHRFDPQVNAADVTRWAEGPTGRVPLAFELRGDKDRTLSVFAREMPDRGFVISFTDVTAERQAAQALFDVNERLERRVEERTIELEDALQRAERANASKTHFVAAASHDLMQPLSAAKLFVASLSDHTDDPDLLTIAAKAEGALIGATQIIETLLDISRLESGSVAFDMKRVALRDILTPLCDEFDPMARQKGLDLRVVASDLTVRSDPTYLRRILQNLIGNAVRYTARGRILVGVRRNGGSARIEIWDTGPGIREEDQRVIFEEFKQAPNADRAGKGHGLGLAIVERACSALGHPLSLWSRPGSGSCFSLNVPLTDQAPQEPVAAIPEQQVDLRGLLVLLVENDEPLARAISMMIEGWGGYVIHSFTAQEALSLLTEIEVVPDALLLDYQLSDTLSGLDLWRTLKGRHGAVPVRILSANRTRELRDACAAAGVGLLTKPLDRTALIQFLTSALNR